MVKLPTVMNDGTGMALPSGLLAGYFPINCVYVDRINLPNAKSGRLS